MKAMGGGTGTPFSPAGGDPAARGSMGGMLPGIGDAGQYDMVKQLLAAGLQSAATTNSPAAAFLAPMAAAMIGGRAEKRHQEAVKPMQDQMVSSVFGDMAKSPEFQGLTEVLNNPNAPDYVRAAAKSKIDSMINPPKPKGTGGGSGGASSGNPARMMAMALAAASDPNGPGGTDITPEEREKIGYYHSLRYAPRTTTASKPDPNDPLGFGADDPLELR